MQDSYGNRLKMYVNKTGPMKVRKDPREPILPELHPQPCAGTDQCPTNMTGGLCGFGHPTGATGVRQVADMVMQLTGRAGDCQVQFKEAKPYAMSINMGGNDKTVASFVMGAS